MQKVVLCKMRFNPCQVRLDQTLKNSEIFWIFQFLAWRVSNLIKFNEPSKWYSSLLLHLWIPVFGLFILRFKPPGKLEFQLSHFFSHSSSPNVKECEKRQFSIWILISPQRFSAPAKWRKMPVGITNINPGHNNIHLRNVDTFEPFWVH